jgi:hypothetical protein
MHYDQAVFAGWMGRGGLITGLDAGRSRRDRPETLSST